MEQPIREGLSERQSAILTFIKEEILRRGYPPTVREIGEAVHLKSSSSVHMHLNTLEQNGYIRRDPTRSRSIEIVDDDFNLARRELVQVPVLGQVAAGQPLLAQQNIEDYFPLPAEYVPAEELFFLRVRGSSMIRAGILDGDQVLVQRQDHARNGEIVVALLEDEATVKTFYKEKDHIRLQPENPDMDPILVPDCQILGKVRGVFRFFDGRRPAAG